MKLGVLSYLPARVEIVAFGRAMTGVWCRNLYVMDNGETVSEEALRELMKHPQVTVYAH